MEKRNEKREKVLDKALTEAHAVLKSHRKELMEITGIDTKKVQLLEEESGKKIREIAERVGEVFREEIPAIAESHKRTLTSQKKKSNPISTFWGCMQELETEDCANYIPYVSLTPPLPDPEDPDVIYPAEGSAPGDKETNTCRPKLELTDEGAIGTLGGQLIFAIDNKKLDRSGIFTVTAKVQAVGFYWLWPLGAACGGKGGAPVGSLSLKATLRVEQAYEEKGRKPSVVLLDAVERDVPALIGFNDTMGTWAELTTEYDVYVIVEFEIHGTLDSAGYCFADFQSVDLSYFRVPQVHLCLTPLYKAIPKIPEWVPYAEAYSSFKWG